ncbi:ABC transporter permease subunit [bacterium]|jgi:ABC-2 type transport system permease protein|nr:ABC transporter permease subunit [bacterium]MDG1224507.1 ABC transporter permease subunit [Candidatus Neomarinimicrobiota bacterium]MBT4250397.1 ABC transporter permease subunit [bacterium]MBT4928235.1 ABC transporter permease subunit [bacterium]MBT5735006.1 ABC transporter permease subunit [bacterium]|tara:strand:- start:238 stop:1077 length:840 start_codon:yes stop_codon:yes gene_type:complete
MIKNLLINEFIKVSYKKRTYISFALITVLIPFIVLAVKSGGGSLESKLYGQLADSFIFVGSLVNGNLSAYIIIAILISHMPFLSTIVASEIVSGEYSKGTFRMYLTRPVSRNLVLFSKLIIVLGYTTLMMFYFVMYTLLVSRLIIGNGDLVVFHEGLLVLDAYDTVWRFFLSFWLSNILMLTVTCLCFMISTLSKNSVTPIIVTISIVFVGTAVAFIPIEFFELLNPYLFTGYIDLFLTAFHDPLPKHLFIQEAIVCGIWSTVFIVTSFYYFNRCDILD